MFFFLITWEGVMSLFSLLPPLSLCVFVCEIFILCVCVSAPNTLFVMIKFNIFVCVGVNS